MIVSLNSYRGGSPHEKPEQDKLLFSSAQRVLSSTMDMLREVCQRGHLSDVEKEDKMRWLNRLLRHNASKTAVTETNTRAAVDVQNVVSSFLDDVANGKLPSREEGDERLRDVEEQLRSVLQTIESGRNKRTRNR